MGSKIALFVSLDSTLLPSAKDGDHRIQHCSQPLQHATGEARRKTRQDNRGVPVESVSDGFRRAHAFSDDRIWSGVQKF